MLGVFREKETVRVVNDQFGSPTYAAALAANVAGLVAVGERTLSAVYHYCDRGVISWFDFAAAIMDLALESGMIEKKIPIEAIPTAAFPTRAARPLHAVLDSGKAASASWASACGPGVPTWRISSAKRRGWKGAGMSRRGMSRRLARLLLGCLPRAWAAPR